MQIWIVPYDLRTWTLLSNEDVWLLTAEQFEILFELLGFDDSFDQSFL